MCQQGIRVCCLSAVPPLSRFQATCSLVISLGKRFTYGFDTPPILLDLWSHIYLKHKCACFRHVAKSGSVKPDVLRTENMWKMMGLLRVKRRFTTLLKRLFYTTFEQRTVFFWKLSHNMWFALDVRSKMLLDRKYFSAPNQYSGRVKNRKISWVSSTHASQ